MGLPDLQKVFQQPANLTVSQDETACFTLAAGAPVDGASNGTGDGEVVSVKFSKKAIRYTE